MLPASGITIYHNPQCSKSRSSAKLLEENQEVGNYTLETVKYKATPPPVEVLNALVDYLGIRDQEPSQRPWDYLLRPEAQGKAASFEEAFDLISKDPALLERPFVIDWDRKVAALGRPDISKIQSIVDDRKAGKL
ncbi:hypothetical protein BCR43DRAFT_514497 [Syncephalastrum racemosum]|uniref:Thioredoxin-like protein n=1 Tax=Syncephalastrum racemosum TaxID=13706 RepID=A0A1X2HH08_SYNRA|nr:hypothetical protein BCR43DRAFT_514497 [Syncephalastrum racemosum]